ncbi:MAG: glycosyltransferase family 4 protein [Solirubrobacterales bacterium]
MDRLRLHILIDSLEPGGAQNLLPGFAIAATRAGIAVSISYLRDYGGPRAPIEDAGIEPTCIDISSLLGRNDRARVRDHLARSNPDLLHTHLGYSDVLGGLAARSLGIPAVSTLHAVTWSTGAVRNRIKDRLQAAVRRRCASRVIAVCDAARRRYLALRWDLPERVVTVHNGIVDAARPGSGRRVRAELGLTDRDIVLTMVSVLRRDKAGLFPPPSVLTVAGHDIAVAAVSELASEFPDIRLLVVGDGPDRGAVERAAARLGERALVVGHRGDVPDVLDASDVLIHPAYADAFPTVLLEAMSCSVPVAASSVGGIPEIVVDDETGILFAAPPRAENLASSLRPLLVDQALRRRLGEAGRRRFETNFTTDSWIEGTLPAYESALAAARKSRG